MGLHVALEAGMTPVHEQQHAERRRRPMSRSPRRPSGGAMPEILPCQRFERLGRGQPPRAYPYPEDSRGGTGARPSAPAGRRSTCGSCRAPRSCARRARRQVDSTASICPHWTGPPTRAPRARHRDSPVAALLTNSARWLAAGLKVAGSVEVFNPCRPGPFDLKPCDP